MKDELISRWVNNYQELIDELITKKDKKKTWRDIKKRLQKEE